MCFVVVGKTELVKYTKLIVVLKDGRRLARWSAQCLLLLYVVGELAKRL